jgi:hypothetical protein
MTNHPIISPQDLRNKWLDEAPSTSVYDYLIDSAAQWGADQELDACCALMDDWGLDDADLRLARRPKPPSLKEQALQAWDAVQAGTDDQVAMTVIRRALEAL